MIRRIDDINRRIHLSAKISYTIYTKITYLTTNPQPKTKNISCPMSNDHGRMARACD